MGPLPNLARYAAVARGTTILAEYSDAGDPELPAIAPLCLERIPPLHSRFSYTTRRRMFICIIERPFVYCAIVDEALSKSKAFSFLQQVREEFQKLLKARGLALDGESLEAHSLDDEFAPVFRHLVSPLVGIPQIEKDRMEEELQAQREADADLEVTSPSAVAPLYERDEEDFKSKTEKKPPGSRSPFTPLLGKCKKQDRKKVKDQVKEVKEIMMENKGKALDKGQKLEIMVEGSTQTVPGSQMQKTGSTKSKGQQIAQRMWWRNVKLVLMLDALICLILFGIWLGICRGISCIRKS